MPQLSIIMIVKNEAAVLGDCLQSVSGIADEIVVVDTGSTDDTPALAARHGARVYHLTWENDFARARNESLRHATGDWLLHLDADEILDPRGAAIVREIVDTDTETDAVEVTLANYCNDARAWRWVAAPAESPWRRGFAGYLPVPLLRLFRNGRGIEYREAVHENITASVRECGGRVLASEVLIHHYGFECAPDRRAAKARLYLELAREKSRRDPDNLKSLYDLAEQALACGEDREAEAACRHALARAPGHVETATTLANICLNRGELDSARDLLLGLEAGGISLPHIQTALGAIALHRGDYGEAAQRLDAARRQAPPAPIATLYLARVLDYRGDAPAARALLDLLAGAVPALAEVHRRIRSLEHRIAGETCFGTGDPEGALRAFVAALALDGEDALAHNNAGVALHALGQRERARQSFNRALQLAPALAEARDNLRACQP